jgi:hypothetical protein
MSQTTIQNVEAVRWGSAKIEAALKSVGFGSLQNLGAIKNLAIDESWTNVQVDSHNAGRVRTRVKDHKLAIKFDWLEPDFEKLQMLRGGTFDACAPVAGDPVTDHNQYVASGAWSYLGFVAFDKQQGAGTVPTNITVIGSVDGALVADTDYFVCKQAGIWGFYVKDTATVTTLVQILTVQFDYTPAASVNFTSGGMKTINPIVFRFTNTNENSKGLVADVYEATIEKGMSLKYQSDEADDCNAMAIEASAICDETRTAPDQLLSVYDAQSV